MSEAGRFPIGARVRVRPIAPDALKLTPVERAATDDPALAARVAEVWDRLACANPRLFNAPIVAVAGVDESGALRVCRDEYRRLAVQPEVPTGVVHLGVTGAVTATDRSGATHLALGQRAPDTRVYGGLWELAPSGGVDPAGDTDALTPEDLLVQLFRELTEELGLAVDPKTTIARADPVALAIDPGAPSVDAVYRVELARPLEELLATTADAPSSSRWEYDRVRWVAIEELPAFVAQIGPGRFIPPALPTLRAIGLLR